MDKKTVIQINIEVPHMVDSVLNDGKKFFDGGIELLKFGLKMVKRNASPPVEAKPLKKISIK
ncbi:MAG: hypothetical protein QXZ44_02295 [Ferroplasma sp.]